MGESALKWVASLKKDWPELRFCCEVARPEHIDLCLHYGVDAVWIGARTSVNPFLVGELSEALRGTTLPVMVKNPVTPDISLWLGAIERLQQASRISPLFTGVSPHTIILATATTLCGIFPLS